MNKKAVLFTLISDLLVWIVIFLSALYVEGYVLQRLWAWYVVPVFSVSTISMNMALGLMLLLEYASGNAARVWKENFSAANNRDDKTVVYKLGLYFVFPVTMLITGYIILHLGYLQ